MCETYPQGFAHYPLYFDASQQAALIDAVKAGVEAAPFYQPTMPRTGAPLSVVMSNFGPLGWVTDKTGGYRYEACLLYTSPSPRDGLLSRMPSSA